jgi:predicted XRE-type DNA-binding protein
MKRNETRLTARNPSELAAILGLSKEDAVEIELRSQLNTKIIEVVQKRQLTHEAVARLSGSSRTRVTALMNRNTHQISTSQMIRILAALGYATKLKFSRTAA